MPQAVPGELWWALVPVVVLVALVVLLLGARGGPPVPPPGRWVRQRRRGGPPPESFAAEPADRPMAAIIVNPTKFEDVAVVRALFERVCAQLGWAEPLWLLTTQEDPGAGQAQQALDAGADVVLACGGDGTVRHVGHVLAHSGVALGLLPAGTGNLLARNLDLDLSNLEYAMRHALTGDDRRIDVGRVVVDAGSQEQTFLVMAGLGFDAAIMKGAPESLKARFGPVAYVVSGVRALRGRRAKVSLGVDGEPAQLRRVRSVVVGNCGRLLGGLVLMPDAKVDDGRLDVVALAPRGVAGWGAVGLRLMTRRRSGHPRVERWTARTVTVESPSPQLAQLDGDPIGEVRVLQVRVDPGALQVRVPAESAD